jgi:hypothetical protein
LSTEDDNGEFEKLAVQYQQESNVQYRIVDNEVFIINGKDFEKFDGEALEKIDQAHLALIKELF